MEVTPNALAYLVFLLWPIVCVALFATLRPTLAVAIAFVVGTLFLPELLDIDPPFFPPLDKHGLTATCVLLCCIVKGRAAFGNLSWKAITLFGLFSLTMVISTASNSDPMRFGTLVLQGLGFGEGLYLSLSDCIGITIPFILGAAFYRTQDDLLDLLRSIVIGAIVYVPLIAIELRLSPQLHTWIYGFHQHDFRQAMRNGGYRPTVFLSHGLAVAKFLHEAITIALVLRIVGARVFGFAGTFWTVLLMVVLAVCNSLAALIYSFFSVLSALMLSSRSRLRVALLLTMIVGAYPVLRANGWFPASFLVQLSAEKSADRAQSLEFRFENEDKLLAHALKRPLFGWGGYGRNRIFNRKSGKDESTTDGSWIIELGTRGATGYAVWFAILTIPILAVRRALKQQGRTPTERDSLSLLALLMAVSWVDLLPNSGPDKLMLLLAGAVYGVASQSRRPFAAPMPRSASAETYLPR